MKAAFPLADPSISGQLPVFRQTEHLVFGRFHFYGNRVNQDLRKERKSNHKFEVVGGQELLVRVPLPMAEVGGGMQAQVEELTGRAGLQTLRAILENEVTRRVGPPHRPNPTAGCVRWGKQSGYVVFAGQKIPLERPRVRTREGQEVELESYRQLQRQ